MLALFCVPFFARFVSKRFGPPKVAYGFLSDCVPIRGLKRTPYMLLGWVIHIVCNSMLALMGTPGTNWTVFLSFLSACGYLLSDVMTDTIVVEK